MSAPGRTLIVDDNETTRYVLGTWLRRAGYIVDEASSGSEGLAAVERGDYDVVILDVNLPDISGPEVCERIKAGTRTGSIPVLHVSATAIAPSDRTSGLERGADGYLVEPLEREELLATIGALVRYGRARRRAETLARRLGWLHATSLELNGAGDAEHLVRLAAQAAASLRGGDAVAAVVTDDGGLLARAGHGRAPEAVVVSGADVALLAARPTALLARVAPDFLASDETPRVLSVAGRLEPGVAAALAVATFDDADEEGLASVLGQLAQVVARAAENLRLFDREHAIALMLQRSLLPTIPPVDWLEVAVRYSPSAGQVGGDFYDVVPLDGERVALVIGDVQGHSLRAATIMAMLRNSLAAYLVAGRSPASALENLNAVLQRTHPDVVATVCCIELRSDGRALIMNAGHFQPVVGGGGSARLAGTHGTILGIDHDFEQETLWLEAGDSLVLYTDGLIETPEHPLGDGITDVVTTVASLGAEEDLESFCDRLISAVGPAGAARDDIAVLAVRRHPARRTGGTARRP